MDSVVDAYNFYHTFDRIQIFIACFIFLSSGIGLFATASVILELWEDGYKIIGDRIVIFSLVFTFALYLLHCLLPNPDTLKAVLEKQISLVNKGELNRDEKALLENITAGLTPPSE